MWLARRTTRPSPPRRPAVRPTRWFACPSRLVWRRAAAHALAAAVFALAAVPAWAWPDIPQAEDQFFQLVNDDRVANGVAPVGRDDRLMAIARWRSEDMVARNYYSHTIPAGACFGGICYSTDIDVFKVLDDQGIQWWGAGENVTGPGGPEEQIVANAEASLMGSPAHRANILNPDWTHAGVGIAQGADGRTLFTQLFITAPPGSVPTPLPTATRSGPRGRRRAPR